MSLVVRNKVLELLREIDSNVDFSSSDDFLADGYIDSLGVMSLLEMLESEFDIDINGEDITPGNFRNLETINIMIEKYL
jgi:acyl carrier protein